VGRIVTRGLWVLAVLLCVVAVAWHVLAPSQEAPVAATGSDPAANPSPAAEPFSPLGAAAPVPDAASLASAVDADLAGHPGTYNVSVVDAVTGEQLVDRGASTPSTPASSLKLLTGSAALATFSGEHRFPTTATLAADGRVYLVGGGDALLGAGASDPKAVQGRAGLATLAEKTVAALRAGPGDGSGPYEVAVDDSLFPGAGLNPDWAPDLVTSDNITEIQTPAMNAGRASASHSSAVVRNPARAALKAFVSALNAAGAKPGQGGPRFTEAGSGSVGDGAGDGAAGGKPTELARVESATLLEQLHYMERNSDNFMAETFGRLVAVARGGTGDIEGASTAVADAVKELGVDTTGLHMADTSGLAAVDKVSPATLAGLLARAATGDTPDLRELAGLLPVSGSTGTLAGRLGGEDTGLVRAKTGTLAAVVSLSGYVTTADGRLLSFSVMADDVRGALAEARDVVDSVAATLAGCGCTQG